MTAPKPVDSAVVARLREIAALSSDTLLLANGPPHSDYVLLDVCGEALEHAAQECKVCEQERQCWRRLDLEFDLCRLTATLP